MGSSGELPPLSDAEMVELEEAVSKALTDEITARAKTSDGRIRVGFVCVLFDPETGLPRRSISTVQPELTMMIHQMACASMLPPDRLTVIQENGKETKIDLNPRGGRSRG